MPNRVTPIPVLIASLAVLACGVDEASAPSDIVGSAAQASLAEDDAPQFSDWSVPINLGPVVNTVSNDQGPFVTKDGLVLYFTSTRPGGFGGQDIYVSRRETVDDAWGPPQNIGPTINTSSNEAGATVSPDGHALYFHSNRLGGFGANDLYVSRRRDQRDDFGWQAAANLGPEINTIGNERGLTLFEDDATGTITVLFDSDRPGGLGGIDIYASALTADESFGPAVLVPELSSPFNDLLPTIRRDGLEIFFDSDRPSGVGLRDVWVATRAGTLDSWSVPANLTVINSSAGDLRGAVSFDGTTLYFGSNRAGGLGDSDLYVSTRTKRAGHN